MWFIGIVLRDQCLANKQNITMQPTTTKLNHQLSSDQGLGSAVSYIMFYPRHECKHLNYHGDHILSRLDYAQLYTYEQKVNNHTNINNSHDHFSPQTIEHKNPTTYGIVNPGSGFGQAQQCDEVKLVNGISIPPLIIGFLTTVQI